VRYWQPAAGKVVRRLGKIVQFPGKKQNFREFGSKIGCCWNDGMDLRDFTADVRRYFPFLEQIIVDFVEGYDSPTGA